MITKGQNRSKLLVKNILASFAVKGWSALIVLLMVPLTLKMLGVYLNGAWLAISGVLVWIDLMDIGLGNGLRNAVAEYIARDDVNKVKESVSSAFFMLAVIVIPMFLLLLAAIHFFDMYAAFGIDRSLFPDLNTVLIVALAMTCGTFILKCVGNFYMGLQLPAVNNLIICIGQTLALVITTIFYFLGSRSVLVVVVINTLSPLVVWAVSALYTFRKRYPQYSPSFRHVNMKMTRDLCSTGVQFFILQICGVILLASTNIIISKLFSPAEVTPYTIVYRYFSLVLVVFNAICLPFWNATTDAYTRNDLAWIHQAGRKLNMIVGAAFVLLALMVLIAPPVYRLWVGSEVQIPPGLSASMALYIFILIASFRFSYILNGINVLRIQLVFTLFATIVFIPLAWLACKHGGSTTWLVLAMCAVQCPGLIANMWKCHQVFRKKQT